MRSEADRRAVRGERWWTLVDAAICGLLLRGDAGARTRITSTRELVVGEALEARRPRSAPLEALRDVFVGRPLRSQREDPAFDGAERARNCDVVTAVEARQLGHLRDVGRAPMEPAGYLRDIDTRVEKTEHTTFNWSKLRLHGVSKVSLRHDARSARLRNTTFPVAESFYVAGSIIVSHCSRSECVNGIHASLLGSMRTVSNAVLIRSPRIAGA